MKDNQIASNKVWLGDKLLDTKSISSDNPQKHLSMQVL